MINTIGKYRNLIKPRDSSRGFTLLEIMIVLAIVASVVAVVIPKLSNKNREMKAAVRKFSVLGKELHALAKLKGATYRLVIDFKTNPEDEHAYWVEMTQGSILVGDQNIIEQEQDTRKESEDDENAPPKAGEFTLASDVFNGPQKLPKGLRFEDVEVISLDKPVTTGKVYVHFLPQGLVEEAAIHIKADEDLRWTVAIHPLTGKGDVVTSYVSLRDIRDQ